MVLAVLTPKPTRAVEAQPARRPTLDRRRPAPRFEEREEEPRPLPERPAERRPAPPRAPFVARGAPRPPRGRSPAFAPGASEGRRGRADDSEGDRAGGRPPARRAPAPGRSFRAPAGVRGAPRPARPSSNRDGKSGNARTGARPFRGEAPRDRAGDPASGRPAARQSYRSSPGARDAGSAGDARPGPRQSYRGPSGGRGEVRKNQTGRSARPAPGRSGPRPSGRR
jgi:hypothetical protein